MQIGLDSDSAVAVTSNRITMAIVDLLHTLRKVTNETTMYCDSHQSVCTSKWKSQTSMVKDSGIAKIEN